MPGVFKVSHWLPAGEYVVVTGPLDEIMQLLILPPRVEYAVDYPFLRFVDYCWEQFRGWLASDWGCLMTEKCHMENVVGPHCTQ